MATLGLGGLLACGDGQAPPDYRGEPLMTLHGVVASSQSPLTQNLVPAVMLVDNYLDSERAWLDDSTAYYIQGDVEGTFPNSFTLRLYEPPPDSTLITLFEGESQVAQGQLTAMSPQHPAWLRRRSLENPSEERAELCSETDCISGRPADCTMSVGRVSEAAWPCGGKFPAGLNWETYGYSEVQAVTYFKTAVPAGSVLSYWFAQGEAIAPGYHVSEFRAEASEAARPCTARAQKRALDEWNEAHGTNAPFFVAHSLAENVAQNNLLILRMKDEGCDSGIRIVDGTAAAPVHLSFSDTPNYSYPF